MTLILYEKLIVNGSLSPYILGDTQFVFSLSCVISVRVQSMEKMESGC